MEESWYLVAPAIILVIFILQFTGAVIHAIILKSPAQTPFEYLAVGLLFYIVVFIVALILHYFFEQALILKAQDFGRFMLANVLWGLALLLVCRLSSLQI